MKTITSIIITQDPSIIIDNHHSRSIDNIDNHKLLSRLDFEDGSLKFKSRYSHIKSVCTNIQTVLYNLLTAATSIQTVKLERRLRMSVTKCSYLFKSDLGVAAKFSQTIFFKVSYSTSIKFGRKFQASMYLNVSASSTITYREKRIVMLLQATSMVN